MVHEALAELLIQRQQELAEAIVTEQFKRQPDLLERYGETARERTYEDVIHHITYLSEALAAARLALFADYLAWVREMLEVRNVLISDLVVTLNCMRDVLQAELSPKMMEVVDEYLRVGEDRVAGNVTTTPPIIDINAPHGELAAHYLQALLAGDRYQASEIILQAVQNGVSVKDVYLHVFQPVQYEIGRLWQTNQISVAHEHFATAVTQLVMSQLYDHIFSAKRVGRTLVATCVGGELHEIGLRMVADFFEMHGWDTFYLGANTPVRDILQFIKQHNADILAISATLTPHVRYVRELVRQVRAAGLADVKILVGGYPFNISRDLWKQVGADGYALNAAEAVSTANQLMG